MAVIVASNSPSAVALPVMTPVAGLIDRPGGRPVALNVSVWPAPESVALTGTVTAVPAWIVSSPAAGVTVIVFHTRQVNEIVADAPVGSLAVTATS